MIYLTSLWQSGIAFAAARSDWVGQIPLASRLMRWPRLISGLAHE
jgi:hypothetical protein